MTKNKTIFLQLNELNFDFIKIYIKNGLDLPGFKKILNWKYAILKSEKKYELLEPWIQWASIHSGLEYKDHKCFRLGDAVKNTNKTIFELLEDNGYTVGAISPMNVVNRLQKPKFFIPDPWTNTKPDKSWVSKFIHKAIRQVVNDNSTGKIGYSSFVKLFIVGIKLLRIKDFFKIFFYFVKVSLGKKWFKVLAFDFFLSRTYSQLNKKYNPDFSVLFLNGGAHIQHHYLLSSSIFKKKLINNNPNWYIGVKEDPIKDLLIEYDKILQELIEIYQNYKIIVCTGLTQEKSKQNNFYYRLIDHEKFLKKIGLNFICVEPRMSRDFLIKFENVSDRNKAYKLLSNVYVNQNVRLFGLIEKRKDELFVTLDYADIITNKTNISKKNIGKINLNLKNSVSLVAIKNGIHSDKCFLFTNNMSSDPKEINGKHCKNIFNFILKQYPKKFSKSQNL